MKACIDCGKRLTYVHRCKTPGAGNFDTERQARDAAWFHATGHCGGCGQPATFCQCTEAARCGCRELHTMGSGIGVDGAELFATTAPTVTEDQGELFA